MKKRVQFVQGIMKTLDFLDDQEDISSSIRDYDKVGFEKIESSLASADFYSLLGIAERAIGATVKLKQNFRDMSLYKRSGGDKQAEELITPNANLNNPEPVSLQLPNTEIQGHYEKGVFVVDTPSGVKQLLLHQTGEAIQADGYYDRQSNRAVVQQAMLPSSEIPLKVAKEALIEHELTHQEQVESYSLARIWQRIKYNTLGFFLPEYKIEYAKLLEEEALLAEAKVLERNGLSLPLTKTETSPLIFPNDRFLFSNEGIDVDAVILKIKDTETNDKGRLFIDVFKTLSSGEKLESEFPAFIKATVEHMGSAKIDLQQAVDSLDLPLQTTLKSKIKDYLLHCLRESDTRTALLTYLYLLAPLKIDSSIAELTQAFSIAEFVKNNTPKEGVRDTGDYVTEGILAERIYNFSRICINVRGETEIDAFRERFADFGLAVTFLAPTIPVNSPYHLKQRLTALRVQLEIKDDPTTEDQNLLKTYYKYEEITRITTILLKMVEDRNTVIDEHLVDYFKSELITRLEKLEQELSSYKPDKKIKREISAINFIDYQRRINRVLALLKEDPNSKETHFLLDIVQDILDEETAFIFKQRVIRIISTDVGNFLPGENAQDVIVHIKPTDAKIAIPVNPQHLAVFVDVALIQAAIFTQFANPLFAIISLEINENDSEIALTISHDTKEKDSYHEYNPSEQMPSFFQWTQTRSVFLPFMALLAKNWGACLRLSCENKKTSLRLVFPKPLTTQILVAAATTNGPLLAELYFRLYADESNHAFLQSDEFIEAINKGRDSLKAERLTDRCYFDFISDLSLFRKNDKNKFGFSSEYDFNLKKLFGLFILFSENRAFAANKFSRLIAEKVTALNRDFACNIDTSEFESAFEIIAQGYPGIFQTIIETKMTAVIPREVVDLLKKRAVISLTHSLAQLDKIYLEIESAKLKNPAESRVEFEILLKELLEFSRVLSSGRLLLGEQLDQINLLPLRS